MAKATALCTCATCGNTFKISQFRQNRRMADEWKEWAESHYDECPDCYRQRLADEQENRAKAEGFPDLSGSPKQISWAVKLRDDLWNKYKNFEDAAERDLVRQGDSPEDRKHFEIGKARCRKVFQTITEAKDYIDGRNEPWRAFMATRMEPLPEANPDDPE